MNRVARTLAWTLMRRVAEFDLGDLIEVSGRSERVVAQWLTLLVDAGYVERLSLNRGKAGTSAYALLRNTGVLAPYWDREHGFVDPNLPGHPSDPEQRIWESIKIFRQFTPLEVARAANVRISSVQRYLKILYRSNYLLRAERKAVTQEFGYQLVRDTGAIAPHIEWRGDRAARLFDGNLLKFVWEEADG